MTQTSTERHQLPGQIINAWDNVMDQVTTLSEADICFVRAAIRYSLPPISRLDVLKGLLFYINDHQPHTTRSAEALVEHLPVQTEKCRHTATSHPLYTAMMHLTGNRHLAHPFQQSCRRMLSDYFAHVSEQAHPETLYNHIVQSRDVLWALSQQGLSGPTGGDKDDDYLVGQVNNYLTRVNAVTEDEKRKSITFLKLYHGKNRITSDHLIPREPGIRSGTRGQQRRKTKQKPRDKRLDQELLESLQQRASRHQASSGASTTTRDLDAPQSAAQPDGEFDELIRRGPYRDAAAASPSTAASEADEHDILLQRRTPSTMTVDDDRAVVHHVQRMSLVDTLTSMTDIHRLTTRQLREALDSCRHDPTQWALSMLLLCTGMPLARLETLTVVMASTEDHPPEDDETPKVVHDGTLLTFRLLDGPSRLPDTDDHRWVTLALPHALIQAIHQAVEHHGDRPFHDTAKQLQKTWARQTVHSAGLPPTPNRLTASSWMLIRPAARDDVTAKALSGRFGIALSAPAAYRTLAPGELNTLFQHAVACLLSSLTTRSPPHWLTIAPVAWGVTPNPLAANWHTGSPHAVPISAFRSWFEWLQRGMGSAVRRFMSPLRPRDRSPDTLLEVLAISAAHSYLVFLLSTGCRPQGSRVRCERVADDLWLADKDSRRAQESRWIPIAKELQASLDAHQTLVAEAMDWLRRRGFEVTDHRLAGEYSLCAEINRAQRSRMAVTSITHRGFIQTLTTLQPPDARPDLVPAKAVRNVTRHSVTTSCRGRLPTPQLDAILGHVHGFRQQGPGSSAAGPGRRVWQTMISDLLKEAGHHPLNRSSLSYALGQ
ncbi:hypothetical protein [Halomonas daqiaonensis]|uniref:Uncharacterized protein n=1 Tax=Halomonas daqiaonensis TaxID=650850 RepID=A0A1H7VLG6_9GAMM|nr:hypothetical protein [Halomonas daqiaonensis]SEM10086.1 hypothetical protein SAMN04488129_1263 [Halomonas daqiaonensis]